MEPAPPLPDSDEPAMVAAAQRSPAAFAHLYELHVHRIYQYSLYRTRNPAEAEEVTAQTFARALEFLPRYRWQGVPFAVWLYRIAGSVLAKRQRPAPAAGAWLPVPEPPPGAALEASELRGELLAHLYNLSDLQQLVLILRFAQELSYDKIAAVMGRKPDAVRQLAHRALQNLRERMGNP